MSDKEINEALEFLKLQIPLKYDMNSEDLKYDKRSPYYKIFKYILILRKELEEKWH